MAEVLNESVWKVAMVNHFYEFSAFCTSIVIRKNDGSIIHGKNTDYRLPEIFKYSTYNGNFMKGGKLLYIGTQFAGVSGIYTGARPGGFNIS